MKALLIVWLIMVAVFLAALTFVFVGFRPEVTP